VAVQNGELDGGAPLAFDPDVLASLADDDGVSTAVGSGGGTFDHLELNSASPALADVALRKAILTALDVAQLRRRTFGDVDPAPALRTNLFFEQSDPRYTDVVGPTGFGTGDLDAARSILSAAGYTGASAGWTLAKDGAAVPELRFVHGPNKATLAEVVQSELAELGLAVTLVPVAPQDALTTLAGGGFDLAAFSLGGGPLVVGAPGQLFRSDIRSDSQINFTKVEDPAIDGLIDQLRSVVDPDEVADLANQIATLAIDHATVLPLWDNPSFSFVRDGYAGVDDNRYSSARALYDIGTWTTAG
jgi:peptide/nickel transport system substrate-binding protein